MKSWQRNGILTVALLVFGAGRMPFEESVARELRSAGLTPAPMDIDTRAKVGQTSSAIALGGLRTLVASFMNLRAFAFFENLKWDEVAETYEIIVDLAPKTRYYWESGYHHSAYNAASFYINDSSLPSLRRKEAWRRSIVRGRSFLERGIRNNPGDWILLSNLGFMLSDKNKFPAFKNPDETLADAAEAYRKAADTGNAPDYVRRAQFFSFARVKGKELEALAMARSLYANPRNRLPTLLSLLFVLEAYENPDRDPVPRAIEIFGSPEKAYESLCNHWLRTGERFPVFGVARALESLEKQLKIPADKSIFSTPLPPPRGPDNWFEE